MANQAIALQARAPQMPNIGSAMQQNAQMINMMAQQKAAERQAAQAQQKMQLEQEAAGREAEKAKLDRSALVYAEFRRLAPVVAEGGPEVYRDWLAAYGEAEPRVASVIAKAMPPERFNKDAFVLMMGSMDQRFDARYGKAITKELIDPEGNVFGANISGIPGATYAVPVPDISRPVGERAVPPAGAPSAPALAPSAGGVSARPTRGANTTPQDLLRQGVDPRSIPMGNPLVKPISFEGGEVEPLTVENAPQIVQAAIDSGFIDPSHVEQLKQMVGPENGAAVDQWVQQSGLKMGSGVPGARSAVYRPQAQDFGAPVADDGMPFEGPRAPMGQQVQYNPNDYAPVRVKSPMQSPLPGSAQVPLPRVRAEAQAQRETPGEVYAKEKARAKAQREAALEAGPKPLTPVQEAKLRDNIAKDYKSAQSTIDMMLNPVSGVIAAVQSVRNLTPEQKEAVTGWSGYVPSISASSRSADTKIKNLKGKVTEMGKAAASLTGAIGQMAVQEWRIVSDMIANLDLEGMNASDLDDQLQIIESQARRAAAVTQDAYENQYVEEFARYPNRFQLKVPGGAAPAKQTNTSNLPRVRNNADYSRLKPGTLFIDPNGETRRKP